MHDGKGRQKQFCNDNCRVKLGYRRKHGVTTNRERLERRTPYIGPPTLSEPEKAWLAAMFDAEGWIGLGKQQKKNGHCWYYFGGVNPISNTNPALINRVVELLGKERTRTQSRKLHGNFKAIQNVLVERLYMSDVLQLVRPYLIAKGRQADIVIEFCTTHDALPVRTSPLDQFEKLHLECRALNKRGRT